jgi:ABC-type sugar transport system ATPase subunit
LLTDPKLRAQVDQLWDKFWTGGLTNPLDAIEQFSYLLFLKRLDDAENRKQRQAVAVGRALLRGGEIIIMDEPTAALGVEQTREVLRLINNLRSRGKTVIIISHNLRQVFEIADQISVMYHGEMVGTRRTSETTREEIVSMIVGFASDAMSVA